VFPGKPIPKIAQNLPMGKPLGGIFPKKALWGFISPARDFCQKILMNDLFKRGGFARIIPHLSG